MHVTLIGMSNIGKTHWAERLKQEAGFTRIDCDALVEEKLGTELSRLGVSGIRDVAKWMGQPFDPQYPETSKRFIKCEREVMLEVIAKVRFARTDEPVVIDTTGSVIYTGDDIAAALRELTRVVYLDASKEHELFLFERYIAEPKPVIWGEIFSPRSDEKTGEALGRCYPELLEYRAGRYGALGHAKLPFEVHRHRSADIGLIVTETL